MVLRERDSQLRCHIVLHCFFNADTLFQTETDDVSVCVHLISERCILLRPTAQVTVQTVNKLLLAAVSYQKCDTNSKAATVQSTEHC